MITTAQYIDNFNGRYKLGKATEHTFRGELTNRIELLVPTFKNKKLFVLLRKENLKLPLIHLTK